MRLKRVRVGLVGIGNCASSFVQGLTYYRSAQGLVPGLMHAEIGGYGIVDIEVSAAFDIATQKVGRDLAEAIFVTPNNTHRFAAVVPKGLRVERGRTLDGIGRYLRGEVTESDAQQANVIRVLRETGTEVLVTCLPVGSQRATEWYAEQALGAGCAFVNCIPVLITSSPEWQQRFAARRLPLIGDDIKGQVGAIIVHRVLINLFRERGVALDRAYQFDFGGNADFLNTLERERLQSKKISKAHAVTSQMAAEPDPGSVHVRPIDFVPWLGDRKVAHSRMEGTAFGGVSLNLEPKLEVWDSPNSAGMVVDAVRCAKLALDRGMGGPLTGPSGHFMKSPPEQSTDAEARARTQRFVAGEA